MTSAWMIRAGKSGSLFDKFSEDEVVAIGWAAIGPVSTKDTRESLSQKLLKQWPDWHPQKIAISAGQLYRFRSEIRKNDWIITYDPSRRIYKLGKALGQYYFSRDWVHDDAGNFQKVKWIDEVARDHLSIKTKNSLGAISTLFKLSPGVISDILSVRDEKDSPKRWPEFSNELNDNPEDLSLEYFQNQAAERIKDKISRLTWEEMQELVAGVLRAMGYKTRISPRGSDRGKDIVASPDGFGFENPRIIVEVKHRINTAMTSSDVRSFLGGRQEGDKGLFVSTGGFTKDAYYEAERAKIPLVLMTLQELTDILFESYGQMDSDVKSLIPLTKVYWPT